VKYQSDTPILLYNQDCYSRSQDCAQKVKFGHIIYCGMSFTTDTRDIANIAKQFISENKNKHAAICVFLFKTGAW